ncbi:hypothetical protein [Longimicrobium sp.]|uniref:hypothetical protein n=1 Tax=Longimicrobium sp. TaxID=2029185 RepID=UPI002E3165F6|nr:hypothetical protein [Longimicrobium sp.]HEX6041579.1 hypothetical protein [Longimicrobium sp.]
MIPVHEARDAFVLRLLADAERHAADGRSREAMLLLGWASRAASHDAVPSVLLAYHRIRATRSATASAGATAEQGDADLPDAVPHGARQVETDALGFPVPQFPTRVPELDRCAFVPRVPLPSPAREVRNDAQVQRRLQPRILTAVAIAGAAAITLFSTGRVRAPAGAVVSQEVVAEAGAALRDGDAVRALALADRVSDPAPEVLLLRGRGRLALGDTLVAAENLWAAASHSRATAAEALEAARLLASIPGQEDAAADAYVSAFSAGLPRGHWAEAIDALRRAGRAGEAGRLTELLRRDVGDRSADRRVDVASDPGEVR